MATNTQPFDAAHYLETAADQAGLLSDAVVSGNSRYIAYALGAIARARGGIGRLAREAGRLDMGHVRHDLPALRLACAAALQEDGE